MFTQASVTNLNAATVDLLGTGYGIKSLTWRHETEGDDFPKQQSSGQHEAHQFVRRLTITLVGQLKGSSAADYWTKRAALMAALLVNQGAQAGYKHGTIKLTPAGLSQMYADVVLIDIDVPTNVDEPLSSVYTVSWRCDYGYWCQVSDSSVVKR